MHAAGSIGKTAIRIVARDAVEPAGRERVLGFVWGLDGVEQGVAGDPHRPAVAVVVADVRGRRLEHRIAVLEQAYDEGGILEGVMGTVEVSAGVSAEDHVASVLTGRVGVDFGRGAGGHAVTQQ